MEGKLIKLEESKYTLVYKEGSIAWENNPAFDGKLSLRNCQAIERGYDLDELAEKHYDVHIKQGHTKEDSLQRKIDFILGFQKALEILGDKNFSEEDIKNCWNKAFDVGYNFGHEQGDSTIANEDIDNYIQSLQQTEWDVEIEMICPHPEDAYRCGMEYGCDADGCNHPNKVPYLDSDGCLILKRK